MGMFKNEVTKVNYTLTMNEDEFHTIQNALYKLALHEVKKKAEDQGVDWFDQTADFFLLPEHPLHPLFSEFNVYHHIDSWALSLKLY